MSTVERQHELEQNALAEWIVRLFDAVRPHLVTIIGGSLAIVAAFVSWMVISSTNAATEARSWEAYLGALATGETLAFNEVAQRYPGSTAALWSQLVLADMALTDGAVLAFQDRAISKERLESAADLYTAVLAEGPDGLLAERATFGLAKVRESLGQFEEAQAGYASVANDFPESPLAVVAQEHADTLADEATKNFYDWFFAQNLTPMSSSASGGSEESAEAAADADDPAAGLFDDGPLESTPAATSGESLQPQAEPADASQSETAPAAEPAPTP
jgi:hypothetical protein